MHVDASLKGLRRCYIHHSCWRESFIEPDKSCIHYLKNVLRMAGGTSILVFDGKGREIAGSVLYKDQPEQMIISIDREITGSGFETDIKFVLLQAIPKGSRMDWIVEKAVELGVTAIVPVVTERVIVRLDHKNCGNKTKRWRRIAEAASRQCGRTTVTHVHDVVSFDEALQHAKNLDLFAIAALTPGARPVYEVMQREEPIKSMALLVGPEGDLTAEEYDTAGAAGALPVTFGQRVLRVETASLCGIVLMMAATGNGVLA